MIEKKALSSKGGKWLKVVTLDATSNKYCVENLKECEYQFRVFAENSIGVSAPATTEVISLKKHASESLIFSI